MSTKTSITVQGDRLAHSLNRLASASEALAQATIKARAELDEISKAFRPDAYGPRFTDVLLASATVATMVDAVFAIEGVTPEQMRQARETDERGMAVNYFEGEF